MKIACFGSGQGEQGEPMYDAMVEVGRLLALRNALVMTGGFGGAGMEAPCRGAREAEGSSVGYTWLGRPGNSFLSDAIDCSVHQGITMPLEIQYGIRLGKLLMADGFIVAADGGSGTMVELMSVINLGAKLWQPPKRIAILKPGIPAPGWDTIMFNQLSHWGTLPETIASYISFTSNPAKAVDWVLSPRS